MDKENEKLISELYGIRGGLSLISEQYDAVYNLENDNKKVNEEINLFNEEIEHQKEVAYYSVSSAKLNLSRFDSDSNRNKFETPNIKGVVIAAIVFFAILAYGIYNLVMFANEMMVIVFSSFAAAVVIAALTVLIVVFTLRKKKNKKRERLAGKLKQAEMRYKEDEQIIEEASIEPNRKMKKQIEGNEALIKQHILEASKIKQSIINSFGNTISESDWVNIDLIIFYFQSGRAISLRDALQLVDRQRQTEAIIAEIKHASEEICYEIRSGLNAVKEQIKFSFEILSVQLARQHVDIINQIDTTNRLLNALNIKADISCEQLVSQSTYLNRIYRQQIQT
ncbi:MAG: hypothetical protein LUF82_03525 [Clostridia bacterium]|nr:hypothetical protein [Clostridia bacterium]